MEWGRDLYADAEAAKYVDGLAFHWYAGGLIRDLDGAVAHYTVDTAFAQFPDAKLLPSEGCNCPGVKDSDLLRSERYAHDMLRVLKSGAVGWVDWNLLLDFSGGPNHLGNDCDAPIHAEKDFRGVHVQSYLDVIGHFSRHITPGSRRVQTDVRGAFDASAQTTAARASVGFELTLWPCEGPLQSPTPRQNWRLTNETYLEMVDHTQKGNKWKQYCVGEANDPNLQTVSLVSCQWGREHAGDATGEFEFMNGKLRETASDACLTYGKGHDPTLDGAPLMLEPCAGAPAFTLQSGAIVAEDGRCVTAGWPFFQGVAFERPGGDVAVVVVNEASAAAQFELAVDGDLALRAIGPHTINTFVVSKH